MPQTPYNNKVATQQSLLIHFYHGITRKGVLPMRRNFLTFLGSQGSWRDRKERLFDPPLLCNGENLSHRLDHSPAATNISYTEVSRVSRELYIWADQGRLSKTGSRPRVPAKVIFFEMLFLSQTLGRDFSWSPPTSLWPWEL